MVARHRYRRAYKDPREGGGIVGARFASAIKAVKQRMLATDDNIVVICAGQTGSGKTSLGFAAGEIYQDGTPLDTSQVAMDQERFVSMLLEKKADKGAFLMYDEGADVNRRSSMTAWNRDFLEALMTLRGKNWFLWINLPDPNYLDRMLLESELINYFVFVHRKQKRFLLFGRVQLQELLRVNGDVRPDTLKKYGKRYALIDSWWLKYQGGAWDEYLRIKEASMDARIQRLHDKYGANRGSSPKDLADVLGVHKRTIERHLAAHADNEALLDAKDALGRWRLSDDHLDFLRGVMQKR